MIFAVLLYGMFALISLLLVVMGSQVYRGIVRRTDARSEARASLSYVANRVRSADRAELSRRGDLTVLVLPEESGSGRYETLIYFYEGTLRELFRQEGGDFAPESGEALASLQDFSVSEAEDGLLRVVSRDTEGNVHTLHIRRQLSAADDAG